MKTHIAFGAATALALAASLALPGAANALTYTSLLEYSSTTYGPSGPFGTVTIEEVDANNVRVTVDLDSSIKWFVDTSRSHDAFSFNIVDSPESTVTIVEPAGGGDFQYRNRTSSDTPYRSNDPFGKYANAFALDSRRDRESAPLVFNVYNANGITFAGIGAAFDSEGRLVSTGTGNRFFSNSNGKSSGFTGGWWFAAEVVGSGNTSGFSAFGQNSYNWCNQPTPFTIAARDAFVTTGVPEPATWALMILGFGGSGVALRRRRVAVA